MKKRTKLLAGLLSVAMSCSLLAGCGNGGSKTDENGASNDGGGAQEETNTDSKQDGATQITFWNMFGGGEGDYVDEIVKNFNESQSEVTVEAIRLDSNEFYAKYGAALSAGKGPDVAVTHCDKLAPFVNGGQLAELDDLAKQENFDFSTISDLSMDAVTFDGKVYSVPLDTHFHMCYYNKELLKDAGKLKEDLAVFSQKISKGMKCPAKKFILQMLYGILESNTVHLSGIARSLEENTSLKKTIDRLSKNLFSFDGKENIMKNYIKLVKKEINEKNCVIVIDNSDITKPYSKKMEALSDVRDGSTGEIKKGYLTIEAAVLSKGNKMPLPVYEKVFSVSEKGFLSETDENLKCLHYLSANFKKTCIRTLDRGFDAKDYYRYFLKRD